jgi:hypothetical protein
MDHRRAFRMILAAVVSLTAGCADKDWLRNLTYNMLSGISDQRNQGLQERPPSQPRTLGQYDTDREQLKKQAENFKPFYEVVDVPSSSGEAAPNADNAAPAGPQTGSEAQD